MVTTTTTKDLVENCIAKEVAESSHHMGLDPQKQEQMKASLLTAGTNNWQSRHHCILKEVFGHSPS